VVPDFEPLISTSDNECFKFCNSSSRSIAIHLIVPRSLRGPVHVSTKPPNTQLRFILFLRICVYFFERHKYFASNMHPNRMLSNMTGRILYISHTMSSHDPILDYHSNAGFVNQTRSLWSSFQFRSTTTFFVNASARVVQCLSGAKPRNETC